MRALAYRKCGPYCRPINHEREYIMSDYRIETQCPACTHRHVMYVPLEGYIKRQNGALIQDAFPNMSADDRERMITGLCPDCWEINFGED